MKTMLLVFLVCLVLAVSAVPRPETGPENDRIAKREAFLGHYGRYYGDYYGGYRAYPYYYGGGYY